ncbi:xylulokinase [Zophobihabitans entericus]|uniref:Xylulose kinase n=1 Tax=Zophobihabitans entericus TaxID=1635327 RepID=A0A6G9IBN1_9GAMM|nr:xylulokinase [Zophobihabitans entericus]QIQ21242.1 xylulokinase [Zophobihabitans entericus]
MYIGIDLGTSGVKVILMDEQQNILDTQMQPVPISRPQPLWSEQNPEDWWLATDLAMLALNEKFNLTEVKAIGLSGQMHGATLLNKQGDVLRPAILWNDGRCSAECFELEQRVPNSRKITGNIMMPGFTAPKLKWVAHHEPAVFAQIDKVLLPKDYLRYKMTNEFASDMSDSAGTMWLDVAKRDWSDELLTACDLSRHHMPKLYEGTEITGMLLPDVAKRWGLNQTPVVAGGGDNAAGAVGVGLYESGQAMLSLGTSGVYFIVTDKFLSKPEQAVHSFCHAIPDTWHLMSVMLSASSCLDWACNALNISSVAELLTLVESSKPAKTAVYFLPYLSGERTPYNNPNAKGVFFNMTNEHNSVDLARAVLEGVSFALANCMEVLHSTGVTPTQINVIGGGARSTYWCQLLSDMTGKTLTLSEGGNVGPALGAAKLAQIACHPDTPIHKIITQPKVIQSFEPNMANYEDYQQKRVLFNKLYQQISPLFEL